MPWRVIVILIVIQIIIGTITLGGVIIKPPEKPCHVMATLTEIGVLQDTDPDPVYGANDSWFGNVTFSVGTVILLVPVDFEGNTGDSTIVNAVASGDTGKKNDDLNDVFYPQLVERDGAPYSGPAPSDPGFPIAVVGSLHCPGTYPLTYWVLFAALNNGETETGGILIFTYNVVLDP